MAGMADEAAKAVLGNPRFLTPEATPENLRTVPIALAVPCPTRTMTRETGLALANLVKPMFASYIPISPDSLEVGEARNLCVEQAREAGAEWIFFVDYDVLPPPNALIKLMSHKMPIVGGVYHSKSIPSWPLLYVKGWPGAFEDYEAGDLVAVHGMGMGCTLIRMDVFDKLEKPYFKTIPGYVAENPNTVLPHMTEDTYFCDKARKAGFDVVADTSIQAFHMDWVNGIGYHGETDPNGKSKRVVPSWIYRRNGQYIVESMADATHPGFHVKKPEAAPASEITKIDLGSGAIPAPGFTGIDAFVDHPGVLKGDISDLSWFRKEHGLVEAIRSSHSFEHLSHRDAPMVLRDWVNTLNPGGTIEIRVPDLEFHARKLVEAIDKGDDAHPEASYWIATIYGWQLGEGQVHLNGFTENRLRQLAATSGLVDIEITKQVNPGSPSGEIAENGELVLTGRRPEVG